MNPGDSIRVKLSSEGAESIAITPVVVRELRIAELVEELLAVSGKDAARIHAALERGSFVSGGTRFRWQPAVMALAELEALLATFPDHEPQRPFHHPRCMRVVLRARQQHIEIPREAATRRRLFRRRSYWDTLVELATTTAPQYVEYSYRDRADCYRLTLDRTQSQRLQTEAPLLKFSTLVRRIGLITPDTADFFVAR